MYGRKIPSMPSDYDDTDSASDCDDYTDPDISDSSFSSSFNSRKEISRSRWTKEEDERLRQVVEHHGTVDWKVIGSYFTSRTEQQCHHRWEKVLSPDLVKGPWTTEEDLLIRDLVLKLGRKKWSVISRHIPGRLGKQCRERWHNHLNPDIKKSAWTKDEDRIIYEAHKKLGNRWAEIAKLLPGRTDNAIKNHWNSTMKRKVETSNPYTPTKPSATTIPSHTTTEQQNSASSSMMYTPDSDFMNANSIRDALRIRGPVRGVVRTLYPMGHDTLSQERDDRSKVIPEVTESPPNWFILDTDGLSPFRDFQDLTECTHPLGETTRHNWIANSDLPFAMNTSTPIKFTHMTTKGSTDYHFDSQALSDLSRETAGGLIPITSPVTSKFSTPPTILRKGRRKHRTRTSSTSMDGSFNSSLSSTLNTPNTSKFVREGESNNTPQSTPIKTLPFSPSQFLNVSTPGACSTSMQLTSTPIGGNTSQATPTTMLTTQPGQFRTPRTRRSLMDNTPRTPTPFKDALAAIEKAAGPIRKMPHTPGQLADISEIIARDEQEGRKREARMKRAILQSGISPSKRVRKSLSSCMQDDQENIPEGRMRQEDADESILASSLLMSPPARGSDQTGGLCDFSIKSLNDAFNIPNTPSPVAMPSKAGRKAKSKSKSSRCLPVKQAPISKQDHKEREWWTITCGQTRDQQYMSTQARRMILRNHKPRSLVL